MAVRPRRFASTGRNGPGRMFSRRERRYAQVRPGARAARSHLKRCHHLPFLNLVSMGRGLPVEVGGPRSMARTDRAGAHRGRGSTPHDRSAGWGPARTHPTAGGAGEQRHGLSAAHNVASTSANSAARSGSRCRISDSTPPIAPIACRAPLAGASTMSCCVVIELPHSHPLALTGQSGLDDPNPRSRQPPAEPIRIDSHQHDQHLRIDNLTSAVS
jgi:hypothetical protein